jgi:hypothetical protein
MKCRLNFASYKNLKAFGTAQAKSPADGKNDLLLFMDTRIYLKNKIRVQGKARKGEKAEHTRSM